MKTLTLLLAFAVPAAASPIVLGPSWDGRPRHVRGHHGHAPYRRKVTKPRRKGRKVGKGKK